MVLIGVDPGVTTGVAVFILEESGATYEDHYQLTDQNVVALLLLKLARHWESEGYKVVLVVEQFDKRPGIVNPDFTPKFINRDIENLITDVEIKWQIPAQAMTLVPPAKNGRSDGLKRFGWYLVSNVHANDAARHVIVYAVETLRYMPIILKGWPKK